MLGLHLGQPQTRSSACDFILTGVDAAFVRLVSRYRVDASGCAIVYRAAIWLQSAGHLCLRRERCAEKIPRPFLRAADEGGVGAAYDACLLASQDTSRRRRPHQKVACLRKQWVSGSKA